MTDLITDWKSKSPVYSPILGVCRGDTKSTFFCMHFEFLPMTPTKKIRGIKKRAYSTETQRSWSCRCIDPNAGKLELLLESSKHLLAADLATKLIFPSIIDLN